MSRLSLQIALQSFLLVHLLTSSTVAVSNSSVGSLETKCIDAERRALLKFKANLEVNTRHNLSSWGNEEEKKDCCSWDGIGCDNRTGHVITLDLSGYHLSARGKYITPPLIELRYLNYLDLSSNHLIGNSISSLIGNNMSSLRHLDLSASNLEGSLPDSFGNHMTSLSRLDLSFNDLKGPIPEVFGNLSSLKYLYLDNNKLEGEIPKSIWNICTLGVLSMGSNNLSGKLPELNQSSSTRCSSHSLTKLALRDNLIMGLFPSLLLFSSLEYLDLSFNELKGPIPKSLWNMTTLSYLDLYNNALEGSIPESSVNNIVSLTHLDLSQNNLNGSIPKSLGNMTLLTELNLGYNQLQGSIPEGFGNMAALTNLDLGMNYLTGSIPITFGNLTSTLIRLSLHYNELEGFIPNTFGKNMIDLKYLELENNKLEGPIPEVFGNMSSLESLYLENNKLEGEIPKSIWNICTLGVLSMGSNNLSGKLPELSQSTSTRCSSHSLTKLDLRDNRIMGLFPSLSLFSSLEYLDLSSNQINGSVHPSIGRLSQLRHLNISFNRLEGIISEAHFSELSQLLHLDLSSNKFIFNVSSAWVPVFRLNTISLSSCKLGPKFPKWLQTQANYSWLDISNAGISDPIPNWFWNTSTGFYTMNVSNNQIIGRIAYSSINLGNSIEIDLSSNQLEGAIPMFLFKANSLNLSRNKFSSLNLMCDVTGNAPLKFLDASHNQLSGKLPDCWSHFKKLAIVNLANNKGLSGNIPSSIGYLTGVRSLHLTNNKFTGEVPLSMKKCKELVLLDVGGNELSGQIPTWIGKKLGNLVVLSVRANNFNGSIPTSLCHLPHLQLLDLSANKISGIIPKCLKNFGAMLSSNTSDISTAIPHVDYTLYSPFVYPSFGGINYTDKIDIIWKGNPSEYRNTLRFVKSIDLSSNMLAGQIPAEITDLVALVSLNLSRNSLSGQIPREIGKLNSLDSLDLSNNQLWGQIPPSLALINGLGVLDLSNNNLSGKIPIGPQLQTYNESAYMGNIGLCGAPLLNKCAGEEEPTTPPSSSTTEEDQEDEFVTHGFYASLGVGYVVGFWGVLGSLIFNKSWRFAYFKVLNDFANWIYVMVAMRKAKLMRTLHG